MKRNPKDIAGSKKPPLYLVPESFAIETAMALQHGAKKYGAFNWRDEDIEADEYIGACKRHLAAWFDGEENDPDSGLCHLSHAAATLAVLIDARSNGGMKDNRPKAGAAAELIKRYTRK